MGHGKGTPLQGRIIRTVRESLGLTQQGFADRLEVSQATVSRWEAGHTQPDPDSRRRMHALTGHSTNSGDAALRRMVRHAPSIMGLLDLNMRVLAVSDRAAHANGMTPTEAVGIDYRPLFTDDLAEAYEAAVDNGFFSGDVLGVDIACRILGLNGTPFYVVANWHLMTMPSTGEPVLLWNGDHVDHATYANIRANRPAARMITLDDWLSEAALPDNAPAGAGAA